MGSSDAAKPLVRCALIGPGELADRFLIPALRQQNGVGFAGVMGRNAERAAAFAAKHGAGRVYETLESLADDPAVDLVLIASPDAMHAPQSLRLLAARKHLLIEKPMTTTAAEARQVVAAAHAAGVAAAVGYHLRFHAGHRLLRDRLRAGELGELRHLYLRWTYPIPPENWRNQNAGGWWSLAALGTHCLDLVSFFSGVPQDQFAATSLLPVIDPLTGKDKAAMVSLLLPRGVTAQVVVSAAYRSAPMVEIVTEKATVRCQGTLGPRGKGELFVNGEPLAFEPEDPYAGELRELLGAIRERRAPEVDVRIGAANIELLERITASHQKESSP